MNRDYTRGYSKGYSTGRDRRWPAHRPPYPPQEQIAALMAAAEKLRDVVDDFCASISEDDEFVKQLEPGIHAVDDAMKGVTEWLNT